MDNLAINIMTAPLGKISLFSIGQSGYIIKSKSGQLLGIDLYLSDCVERTEGHIGFKRMLPKLITPYELDLDVLIATHPHLDHFDIDSIPVLMRNNKTKLFCSEDCKKLIKQTQMDYFDNNTIYVRPGNNYNVGDFSIYFINCDHSTGAPDAVGAIIEVDGKRFLEVGDTCLRLDRVDEMLQFGPLDVLIAPINGAYGNLNEIDCARLSFALKPKITIPCHYAMFASHGGNPGKFIEIMREEYPSLPFVIMTQGESLVL